MEQKNVKSKKSISQSVSQSISQALSALRRRFDGTSSNLLVTTNDERRTTNDERRTTNDERRTTDDGRRTTDDERRTTNDERRSCLWYAGVGQTFVVKMAPDLTRTNQTLPRPATGVDHDDTSCGTRLRGCSSVILCVSYLCR